MSRAYPRYPAYKDSGVEWLGEVPEHWGVIQSRRLFAERKQKSLSDDVQLTASQKYGVIPQSEFIRLEGRRVMQVDKGREILKHIEPNDFLISMRSFEGGIEECRLKGSVSSAYVPLETVKWVHNSFFKYVFKSSYYIRALQNTTDLVRDGQALRFDNFSLVPLPIVSIEEQRQISTFLDQETSRLDGLISEQRRLIDLLREKRSALISHAVTKGLDPNVPMKDSGVEWLGMVPEHWEVKPIWMLFQLGRGRVISNEEILDNPGIYPVYSSQTENEGIMGYLSTFDFSGDYITWTTDGANAGTVFLRTGEFNCTNVCGTLKAKCNSILGYIWRSLSISTRAFVRQDINPKLMNNVMAGIKILVPPLEEQSAIAAYLDQQTSRMATLLSEAERSISLLQERRSALITAAVTGKIDVRGLVEA